MGQSGYDDAVKAAKRFEAFLNGEEAMTDPRSLDELAADIEWDDAQWHADFLRTIANAIAEGLESPAILEHIGGFQTVGSGERADVKGVRGLDALWLSASDQFSSSTEAHVPNIDQLRMDTNVFELVGALRIDYTTARHEDLIRPCEPGALIAFVSELVTDAIGEIDRTTLHAVDALLTAAGYAADGGRRWDAVPPFRVEFVCFDGWRAKEWVEEGGEQWHLWLKSTLGGAVFKVPETPVDGSVGVR